MSLMIQLTETLSRRSTHAAHDSVQRVDVHFPRIWKGVSMPAIVYQVRDQRDRGVDEGESRW